MKKIIRIFTAFVFVMLTVNCGNSENKEKETKSVYEKTQTAFENSPRKSEVKPIMEDVMETYNLEITDENIEKTASMLITLRKDSKVGVTEMDILKHMYQNGSKNNSLTDQAAISFTYLESTK